jgi:rod shape-determining protein MreC
MSGSAQAAIPGQGLFLGIRFLFLAVVALALMVADHRAGRLDTVREYLGLAVSPIHMVVDLPFSAWDAFAGSVAGRQALMRENERLKRQQLSAEYRLQELEALKAENARLRSLIESKDRYEGRVLVAEILSSDIDYPQRFVINRGTMDDVFVGQALLDANGVVGQIASVSPMTSEVILITDASHAIPVSVLRNGIRTIAVGTGDSSRLRLPYLPNSADVKVGDALVTSGLGNVFPAGRPVATVIDFKPGQRFAEVIAEPVSMLDRDREVILVWNDNFVTEAATAAVQGSGR